MDRRGFLKRLGAMFALAPLAKFFPAQPDLRQIGFSIKEELGFLVFKPTAIQPIVAASKFVFVPTFEIVSNPMIRISDIKNRRFSIQEEPQCILTQQKSVS
jgi:hypothetical protein